MLLVEDPGKHVYQEWKAGACGCFPFTVGGCWVLAVPRCWPLPCSGLGYVEQVSPGRRQCDTKEGGIGMSGYIPRALRLL